MNRSLRWSLASLPSLVLALGGCGDDESGSTATGTASGTETGTATDSGTETASESDSNSQTNTNTASDSNSGTTGTATATTGTASDSDSTTAPTTTDSGTDSTTNATDGTTSGSGTDSTDGTTSGSGSTGTTGAISGGSSGSTGGDPCDGMGGGGFDFSYIWIANSPQGTVSKIDTQTATEVARYNTGPGGAAEDPSRTSVSSDGRFAVVANRGGGLTMIAADEEDCVDNNLSGTIETSDGPLNVMAWGSDECVIWNIDLPGSGNTGPRPVSWTIGPQDPITCLYEPGDVWIGWYDQFANTGHFRLVEGMTGATIDDVSVPNWSGMSYGPYGGAVDSDNNFWVVGWGTSGPVVRIDAVTHVASHFGNPGGWIYGMGLDLQGNTWASGCGNGNVYRFVADTQTWETVLTVPNVSCLRGLQVDSNGVAWIARNGSCGLAAIDTSVEPPQAIDLNIPIAGCGTPVGVSIDAEGFVWVVDQIGSAFKIDPDTYLIDDTVTGLVSPYTYSDMTGAGLNNQIGPT